MTGSYDLRGSIPRRTLEWGYWGNLTQWRIAANSVLRNWLKGQLTALEWGVLSFDEVFMPYMLTESGETVAQPIRPRGRCPGTLRGRA